MRWIALAAAIVMASPAGATAPVYYAFTMDGQSLGPTTSVEEHGFRLSGIASIALVDFAPTPWAFNAGSDLTFERFDGQPFNVGSFDWEMADEDPGTYRLTVDFYLLDGSVASRTSWDVIDNEPGFPSFSYPGAPIGFVSKLVIRPLTRDGANVASYIDFFDGYYLPGGAVPETATWAMMIAGFGLVGAAARRRPRTRSLSRC